MSALADSDLFEAYNEGYGDARELYEQLYRLACERESAERARFRRWQLRLRWRAEHDPDERWQDRLHGRADTLYGLEECDRCVAPARTSCQHESIVSDSLDLPIAGPRGVLP